MPNVAGQPNAVDADTQACALDENDEALTDEIDSEWMDKMTDRLCREFARQVQQQENMPATTNSSQRLANVRGLDQLQRTLERLARHESVRSARRARKNSVSPDAAFAELERRLFAKLEQAAAERDSERAQS